MVKTNTKGLLKETIENLTKDWTGGSYHVLMNKSVVPGGRPLIANGYKYNVRKVVSFIVIEVSGNTKSGLPYLSKDPDQFSIFPFVLLLVPLSCISSLGLLMRLNPTTNQGNLIYRWRSSGLLSVFGYVYVRQFIWE